jgi:hypothetical protein
MNSLNVGFRSSCPSSPSQHNPCYDFDSWLVPCSRYFLIFTHIVGVIDGSRSGKFALNLGSPANFLFGGMF